MEDQVNGTPDPAPRPGPSAEARRLIEDLVDAVADGTSSGVTFDHVERDALSAYVAGLEAEVARLREWSHLQAQDIITLGHMAGGALGIAALAQLGADP